MLVYDLFGKGNTLAQMLKAAIYHLHYTHQCKENPCFVCRRGWNTHSIWQEALTLGKADSASSVHSLHIFSLIPELHTYIAPYMSEVSVGKAKPRISKLSVSAAFKYTRPVKSFLSFLKKLVAQGDLLSPSLWCFGFWLFSFYIFQTFCCLVYNSKT